MGDPYRPYPSNPEIPKIPDQENWLATIGFELDALRIVKLFLTAKPIKYWKETTNSLDIQIYLLRKKTHKK